MTTRTGQAERNAAMEAATASLVDDRRYNLMQFDTDGSCISFSRFKSLDAAKSASDAMMRDDPGIEINIYDVISGEIVYERLPTETLDFRIEAGDIIEMLPERDRLYVVVGPVCLRIDREGEAVWVRSWPNGAEDGEPLDEFTTTFTQAREFGGVTYAEQPDLDQARRVGE